MKIHPTLFTGAYLLEAEPDFDERGFFAKFWTREVWQQMGATPMFQQSALAHNKKRGTMRGLHFQAEPHPEEKIVKCIRGRIFQVLVDLRPDSPTRGRWWGTELSENDAKMFYIPGGLASGYLTLEERTDVLYLISEDYIPELQRGIRWDDPGIGIDWPAEVREISERDRGFPDFRPERPII